MQQMTSICAFDAAHRIMNEKIKCFNLHGHRFGVEITFRIFNIKELGYALDFKEVKRIAGGFIDEFYDHATILNPLDDEIIALCEKNDWKLWKMGLGKTDIDINPSAENIGKELFFIINRLFKDEKLIELSNVRLYETPNCWVDTSHSDCKASEFVLRCIDNWRERKGVVHYDVRKDL